MKLGFVPDAEVITCWRIRFASMLARSVSYRWDRKFEKFAPTLSEGGKAEFLFCSSLCSSILLSHLKPWATEYFEYTVQLFWGLRIHSACSESTISNTGLFPPTLGTQVHPLSFVRVEEGRELCLGMKRTKNINKTSQPNQTKHHAGQSSWSLFFFNTEQCSLYSCNMIPRAEVRNITDRLQGVKITLWRIASWDTFFLHKYFKKVFKFIVSSKFV